MSLMIDRFLLSRLESLSALLQVFQIFRGRSKARLCLSCLSSSARHVGHHPSCETCALAGRLTSAATPSRSQPRQPQTRHPSHQRWYVLLLSYSKCQWRKDPHLPSQPLSVRHLPRPTGLPPVAFVVGFRICPADAKTAPKHHRSKKILTPECGCCHRTTSHARKVVSAA